MKAIQAEVDQASAATGKAVEPPPATEAPKGDPEEDAPSEVELNEVDYERQASAKGLDENGSKEAIVLEKTGLIDLENEDHAGKIDKYIEVAVVASRKIDEPLEERRAYYSSKSLDQFIADLVSNFEAVVDVTIEAESIGVKDQAMFDSLLEDAQNADDVKKMVDVAASVGAKTKEDLEQVFKSVGTADSLVKVVDATASLDAAESFRDKNTLGAVFRNANQAEALAEVVSDDTSADKEKKLRSLFTVIKPVDKKKTASKALKEREAIIIDFIPHTVKIELGNLFDSKSLEDKYKDYDASGLYNAEQLSLIKDYKDARVSDVSLANFFSGIKNVVDVTEILIEIASSNDGVSLDNLLDGVVKHADQVTDFKANMEAVLADDNLKGDIGALLENPGNQKAFAKVREEFGGDSAKMKKAVEKFAVVDDLSDAIETANKLKWAGIEFDANVLFNALDLVDPKVASDQENFFESLNRLSDSVQSDFGADESITLLEEAFKNPEKATSLNNLMKASASATDDQKKALLLSAASADTLETEFNSVSGDSTKSANFLTTVQSIGEKKTKAKALAAEARDSAVSDTIKTEIANITSVSALKTKFFELLPASITDENVKKNLFKANERTQPAGVADPVLNVQEILNNAGIATDSSEYNTIKDLWIVANARKNTIISEEGFKNIAALSDIASNSGGSALDVLDSALENVEEVQQFAVLVEVGGVDVTNFDPDSFDFEVAFESGALKTLRSDLFSDRGYTFNEYFDSEDSTPLSLDSDNFAVITAVDSFISSNNIQAVLDPIDPSGDTKILHNDGSFVYELSASQVNTLTGLTDGVAGQYKFEELLDADTGAVTGVTITPATKKLGIDEVLTFSIDAERAGDVLFVLDSPVLKPTEGDSDEDFGN